jgi:hypothetical protein
MKSGCARVISAWHPCQAEINLSHMTKPGKSVSADGPGFLSRGLGAGPDVLSVNPEAA